MSTITCNNQFSGVENILNQIQLPFKGAKRYARVHCLSTMLNIMLFFKVRAIQQKMEDNVCSNDELNSYMHNVKKLRNVLFDLDKEIEKRNVSKIVRYNIHNSLIKLDDLAENLEIFLDDEIQKIGEKIATSL